MKSAYTMRDYAPSSKSEKWFNQIDYRLTPCMADKKSGTIEERRQEKIKELVGVILTRQTKKASKKNLEEAIESEKRNDEQKMFLSKAWTDKPIQR